MAIEHRIGDVTRARESHILHCANAKGVMGAGVALAIKHRWPIAFDDYRQAFIDGELALGATVWSDTGEKVIIHLVGQEAFGRGHCHADYGAIRAGIREVNARAEARRIERIAMPRIGAGLAGGDWPVIERIIEEEAVAFVPVVYTMESIGGR